MSSSVPIRRRRSVRKATATLPDALAPAQEAARLGALQRPVALSDVQVMLAEARERPFSSPGWLYELKYDGYRVVVEKAADRVRVRYRSGRDATGLFPEVEDAVRALPTERLTFDGEACVLDAHGRSRFQLMQQRGQVSDRRDVLRARRDWPVTCFAFDLLALDGFDLRALPLLQRKALLERILPKSDGTLRYSEHVEGRGEELFRDAERLGLEGIVAKRADSVYRGGRSAGWLKITTRQRGDFVVVGFTPPEGSRSRFGALHLALHDRGRWFYAGRVGSGFSEQQLQRLHAQLASSHRTTCPCEPPVPGTRGHTWVEPRLVVEVSYKQWTEDDLLRAPVFLRVRDDKSPEECVRTSLVVSSAQLGLEADPAVRTHYARCASALEPLLHDRRVRTSGTRAHREAPCASARELLTLVDQGAIGFELYAARASAPEHPDFAILRLEQGRAADEALRDAAGLLSRSCAELELPVLLLRSGPGSLDAVLPLGGRLTWAQAATFMELLARMLVRESGEALWVDGGKGPGGRVSVVPLRRDAAWLPAPGSLLARPGMPVVETLSLGRRTRTPAAAKVLLGPGPDVLRAVERIGAKLAAEPSRA